MLVLWHPHDQWIFLPGLCRLSLRSVFRLIIHLLPHRTLCVHHYANNRVTIQGKKTPSSKCQPHHFSPHSIPNGQLSHRWSLFTP